jgi:hypothetical protein
VQIWRLACSTRLSPHVTFNQEDTMGLVGLIVTFAGFLLAAMSVGISSSTTARLGMVLVGIIISLVGIMGVINPAYQKNAVWKK